MANIAVQFPAKQQAQVYATWCNANWPGSGSLAYCQQDAAGHWIVPYLGPPFEYPVGKPIAEPAGGPAMRAAGAIITQVTWAEGT